MYKQKVFGSITEIINFLNEYGIEPNEVISIIPVSIDPILVYNLVYWER